MEATPSTTYWTRPDGRGNLDSQAEQLNMEHTNLGTYQTTTSVLPTYTNQPTIQRFSYRMHPKIIATHLT